MPSRMASSKITSKPSTAPPWRLSLSKLRLIAVIPIISSLIASILAVLILTAGNKPGFMESYELATFNTSNLGQHILPTAPAASTASRPSILALPTPSAPAAGSNPLEAAWNFLTGSVKGGIQGAIANVTKAIDDDLVRLIAPVIKELGTKTVKEIRDAVGLQDYYSIYMTGICHGNYTTTGTQEQCNSGGNATIDVTSSVNSLRNAMAPLAAAGIDFSRQLQPEPYQNAVDLLTSAIKAVVAIFIAGAIFSGFSIFTSLMVLFTPPKKRFMLPALGITFIAMVFIFAGALVVTILIIPLSSAINGIGNPFNLYMTFSSGFLAMNWTGSAFMFVATGTLAFNFFSHYAIVIHDKAAYRQDSVRAKEGML